MSYFNAKMHQIWFQLGLCCRARWRSSQHSPRALARLNGRHTIQYKDGHLKFFFAISLMLGWLMVYCNSYCRLCVMGSQKLVLGPLKTLIWPCVCSAENWDKRHVVAAKKQLVDVPRQNVLVLRLCSTWLIFKLWWWIITTRHPHWQLLQMLHQL